jgi:membrane protein YqaA with SNARE-associated domain
MGGESEGEEEGERREKEKERERERARSHCTECYTLLLVLAHWLSEPGKQVLAVVCVESAWLHLKVSLACGMMEDDCFHLLD